MSMNSESNFLRSPQNNEYTKEIMKPINLNKFKLTKLTTREEVIKMYWDEDMSQQQIAKHFKVKPSTVGRYMNAVGIPIKTPRQAANLKITVEKLDQLYKKEKLSPSKIAEIYNVHPATVQHYIRTSGIHRRTLSQAISLASRKNVNEDFFSIWSNEMAYVLGVLITDGTIEKNGEIRISMTDCDVVKAIAKAMDSENCLTECMRPKATKMQLMFSVGRRKFFEDLTSIGIIQGGRKTSEQTFLIVPDKYKSHF
ncbi:hypothetical protein C1N83_00165 [Priestia aryabhattai]